MFLAYHKAIPLSELYGWISITRFGPFEDPGLFWSLYTCPLNSLLYTSKVNTIIPSVIIFGLCPLHNILQNKHALHWDNEGPSVISSSLIIVVSKPRHVLTTAKSVVPKEIDILIQSDRHSCSNVIDPADSFFNQNAYSTIGTPNSHFVYMGLAWM